MKPRGLFITATDTGVGKTIVTALLLAHLRQGGENAVALKPISSGDRNDARLFHALSDGVLALDEINPVHYRRPLAPLIAARLEKKVCDMRLVRSAIGDRQAAFSVVLVEGVGGLLAPLKRGYSVRNLVEDLGFPLLIVSRIGLGTLNHTALTVEAASAAGIRVLGVVLNDAIGVARGLAERTNPAAIEETCGVKVVASIPYLLGSKLDAPGIRAALRRRAVRQAARDVVALL